MTEETFSNCTDLALKITRAIDNEFELTQRGLDEISIFNCVLKVVVADAMEEA